MNLILFEPEELLHPLQRDDPRASHIMDVLRRKPGDDFDCGIVNGPKGKATVESIDTREITLCYKWGEHPSALIPCWVLCGLPRPQSARKILTEAPILGAARIAFFLSDRGERSYAQSDLWQTGEVRRLLKSAAQQAFCTRLPEVQLYSSLTEALSQLEDARSKLAFDNYSPTDAQTTALAGSPIALAVGSERGWSDRERDLLRDARFSIVQLGSRVLRTETACTAALAFAKTRLGLW